MGNILIGVAFIIYLGMLVLLFGTRVRSGQDGMAYGIVMLMANLGFVICLGIVTAMIGSKGGFSWIGSEGSPKFLIVSAGFIVAMTGVVFFSLLEDLESRENFVRMIVRMVQVMLPLLLLASAAILFNDDWRLTLPKLTYKLPLVIALVCGVIAIAWMLNRSATNANKRVQAASDYEKRDYQNYLDNIENADVMKEMVFLLGYTHANHYPEVRERALAKIKSRPDWQEELARRIQTKWAPDVFTFLASNEVIDKAMFVEPIKEGLLIQAERIRKEIRTAAYASQLPSDHFYRDVQRALQTVDKFSDMATDYRPAVEEMRKALDEPSKIKKPKFKSVVLLDGWLERNG